MPKIVSEQPGKASPPSGSPAAVTHHPFLRSIHQLLWKTIGIDAKRMFAEALMENSSRLLKRRLDKLPHRLLLEEDDLTQHYADVQVENEGIRNVLLSFIVARMAFIENRLGAREITRSTFVDIGDSSGTFIRAMGKRDLSVNRSAIAVGNIVRKGLGGVRGDAMQLPLSSNSRDYALCFETLEHVPDPLGALHELYRVCRKGAFISVPHVSRTTVYPPSYGALPGDLLHIFELSRNHWDALLAHTRFRIGVVEQIPVLEGAQSFREVLAFLLCRMLFNKDIFYCDSRMLLGSFRSFLVYHLVKSKQ